MSQSSGDWVPMFKASPGALMSGGLTCRACGKQIEESPKKHLKKYHQNQPLPKTAADVDDPNVDATEVGGQIYIRKEYVRVP